MRNLLDLPVEILLNVYGTLQSIQDAARLSVSCKALYQLFNLQENRKRILKSIVIDNNLPLPKTPDNTWLKLHFRTDLFWKPTESQLPAVLVHTKMREFLTTTGIPSVICPITDWDSAYRKKDEEAGVGLHIWYTDQLFGRRYPDDDSPPVNFCYSIGKVDNATAMVDAGNGMVLHYEGGYREDVDKDVDGGFIAHSVPSLLALLGTMEVSVARMGKVPSDSSGGAIEKYQNMRRLVLDALRETMAEYDDCVKEGSRFWDAIFKKCAVY